MKTSHLFALSFLCATAMVQAQEETVNLTQQEAIEKLNKSKSGGLVAERFNLLQGSNVGYTFLTRKGESTHLIYSDDAFIVTCEKITGDYMDAVYALHVWRSSDYYYVTSVMIKGCGLCTPGVTRKDYCFGICIEPDRNGENGGMVAFDLREPTLSCYRFKSTSDYLAVEEGRKNPFKEPKYAQLPAPQKAPDLNILLSDTKGLQRVPELEGFVHFFSGNGEQTIRSLDFNTLKFTPTEVCKKIPSLDEIEGLPEGEYDAEEVKSYNGTYLLIYPKSRNGLLSACMASMDGENCYLGIYDVERGVLYPMPQPVIESKGNSMGVFPSFGESDCGNIVFNNLASKRGVTRTGPLLFDPQSYTLSTIKLEGKSEAYINGLDYTPSNAYTLSGKVPNPDSMGSCLSVWNTVPGDDTHTYWLAACEGFCALYYVDEKTKTGKLVQSWQGNWGKTPWAQNTPNPVWVADKNLLCLPSTDNCWDVYEIKDFSTKTTKKFTLCTGAGSDWAIVLPDGRYAGSPGCESFIRHTDVDHSSHVIAQWRNRPGEVLEAIGGDADEAAALKETTRRWLTRQGYDMEAMPPMPQKIDDSILPFNCLSSLPPLITTDPTVTFTGEIHSTKKTATTACEVRVNGALVPQTWSDTLLINPGDSKTGLEITIPLQMGQNNISITPIDSMGHQGNTTNFRVVRSGEKNSRLFVVSLGVSDYKYDNENMRDLKLPAKDAEDIATVFREYGAGEVKTLVLTDEEVATPAVLEKVKDFLAESTIDDRIVLYLAGHGIVDPTSGEYMFIPSEFTPEEYNGITMTMLTDTLCNAPARERVLMMDTCHSGSLGEQGEEKLAAEAAGQADAEEGTRGMKVRAAKSNVSLKTEAQTKRYIEEMFTMGRQYRGLNIIAAAAGEEKAMEDTSRFPNGFFTMAVIDTLKNFTTADMNKDGILSVAELLPGVQARVLEISEGKQRPNIVAAETGSMLIAAGADSEMMAGNWAGVAKRIAKADDAEQALFMLDKICAFYYGNESYVADFNDLTETWQNQDRGYDSARLDELKQAFNLMHPVNAEQQQPRVSPIGAAVWVAAMEKGVEPEVIAAYVSNWRHAEDAADVVHAMVQNGYKGNTCDQYGNPLLFEVSAELVDILLEGGADVNMQDKNGNTMLHKAFVNINPALGPSAFDLERAMVALKHGASTSISNNKGERVDTGAPLYQGISKLASLVKNAPASTGSDSGEGYAPASLDGKKLALYYDQALSVYAEYDGEEEAPQRLSAADINSLPKLLQNKLNVSASVAYKYVKTGSNTAMIHQYPSGEGVSPLLSKYAHVLTHEQMEDIAYTCCPCDVGPAGYNLTFSSATSAVANYKQEVGSGIEMIKNIRVSVLGENDALPQTPPAPAQTEPAANTNRGNVTTVSLGGDNNRDQLQFFLSTIQNYSAPNADMKLYKKRLSMLLPMIINGADVNVTTTETKGNTALHYAAGMGYYDLVVWLVQNGAEVNRKTNRGKTPLDCVGNDPNNNVRNFLRNNGAVKSN